MQIKGLLAWAIHTLTDSTTPHLDAELLLAHSLDLTRAQLIARYDDAVESLLEQKFKKLILRRARGEPIAYLLGYREFWSLNLEVTPATLIPRPETELLVELALQKFPADEPIKVVDLGTGSGAIALAIAHERPHWSLLATDRSAAALVVAERNANCLGIHNISFRQGDWCQAFLPTESFHLVISNPPYIANDAPCFQQKDICFEPRDALVASKNGLSELYLIVQQSFQHLLNDGWLLLEHGFDQKNFMNDFLRKNDYVEIENHADFSGISRVVCVCKRT